MTDSNSRKVMAVLLSITNLSMIKKKSPRILPFIVSITNQIREWISVKQDDIVVTAYPCHKRLTFDTCEAVLESGQLDENEPFSGKQYDISNVTFRCYFTHTYCCWHRTNAYRYKSTRSRYTQSLRTFYACGLRSIEVLLLLYI